MLTDCVYESAHILCLWASTQIVFVSLFTKFVYGFVHKLCFGVCLKNVFMGFIRLK